MLLAVRVKKSGQISEVFRVPTKTWTDLAVVSYGGVEEGSGRQAGFLGAWWRCPPSSGFRGVRLGGQDDELGLVLGGSRRLRDIHMEPSGDLCVENAEAVRRDLGWREG